MKLTRQLLLVGFIVGLSIGICIKTASGTVPEDYRFEVLMGGEPIGTDTVRFESRGDTLLVRRTSEITITRFGITWFDYLHESREVWRDGRLQRLNSTTDNNGKDLTVTVEYQEGRPVLFGDRADTPLPTDVIPTSYWNPEFVERERLLDTQNGKTLDVSIEDLGEQPLPYGDSTAQRYAVRGDLELDIWYRNGRWKALEFQESGYNFVYRPEASS